MPRNVVFAVSDDAQEPPRRLSIVGGPAISETGVVFDMVETGVNIAELLADALDEGAYISAIPLQAVSGNKIFTVDQIVDLTVPDVATRSLRQQGDDFEFGQGQIDGAVGP